MNETAQAIFTIGQAIPAVIFLGIALRLFFKERTLIPLLCLAGGGLAMFLEPIVDVLGLVWFPREGQWVMYTLFDRPIPWFLVVYVWYVGGQAFWAWRRLERGLSVTELWKLYASFLVINVILETPGLWMDLYAYYGAQPFMFFRFPLWWAFVNAAMPIVAGVLIYRLRPHLRGPSIAAIVWLVPMADALTNAAAAFPIWLALNSGQGAVATWPAGFATCALACFIVHICSLAVGVLPRSVAPAGVATA